MKTRADEIALFYETFSRDHLSQLGLYYAETCYFRDPFHEFTSLKELEDLYAKMFDKLKNPKFKITRQFVQQNEIVLFWDFTFNDNFKIAGNTLLILDADNKIQQHIDYWDTVSEIWLKIPVLKHIIKFIYKLL